MSALLTSLLVTVLGIAGATALARTRGRDWPAPRPPSSPPLRRIAAAQVRGYDLDETRFFRADGAPDEVAARRRAGFGRLERRLAELFPATHAATAEAAARLPQLQAALAGRIPFPFRRIALARLGGAALFARADGTLLTDLDGHRLIDLTGTSGANLFGHGFARQVIADAAADVAGLGPTLDALPPLVREAAERLKTLTASEAIALHPSPDEALRAAIGLARFHSRRPRALRFVPPGGDWWAGAAAADPRIGTAEALSDRALAALGRRRDLACVIVEPSHALHPGGRPPLDGLLFDSSRAARFDRAAYAAWLRALAERCRTRRIALILDERVTGFRLGPGGAAGYFGVRPDIAVYGPSLAGGLGLGLLAGRAALLQGLDPRRPLAGPIEAGFGAGPLAVAAMGETLRRIGTAETHPLYEKLDERWDERAERLTARLAAEALPVRVGHLSTIWSLLFTQPSRYNWLLAFYLLAEGVALGPQGTGRILFSLDFDEGRFADLAERVAAAARAMREDGWWWAPPDMDDARLRRLWLAEMARARLGRGR